MPKPRPKPLPPPRPSKLGWLRRHTFLTLVSTVILLIAVSIVGVRIHNHYAVQADRARFTRAEQDISELSASIIAATGQPLKVTSEKFCSRPSVELGDSPLSCNVDALLFYGIDNPSEATAIYNEANNTMYDKSHLISSESSSNLNNDLKFIAINPTNYIPSDDYERLAATYRHNDQDYRVSNTLYISNQPPYDNYVNSSKYKYVLVTETSFENFARAQYYPLNH